MTGVVTPYGLLELGLAGIVAPLYPRARAAWINPRFASRPGLSWAVWSVAMLSLALAISARIVGSEYSSMLQLLLLPPVIYWWAFFNADKPQAAPAEGGNSD